jgi:hypothetical protein
VALLVIATIIALTFDPDDLLPDSGSGGRGDQDGAGQVDDRTTEAPTTAETTTPDTTAAADDDQPTTTAAPADGENGDNENGNGGGADVPDGWRTYTDPQAGYTVAYPGDWQIEPAGGPRTDFRDPESGTYLRVDWTDHPKDDPVADWQAQARSFAGSHEGYEEIAIEPYRYRDYDAARWEFRYTDGGARLHAIDVNLIAGPKAYALYFQTKEDAWSASQDLFTQLKQNFHPAPG